MTLNEIKIHVCNIGERRIEAAWDFQQYNEAFGAWKMSVDNWLVESNAHIFMHPIKSAAKTGLFSLVGHVIYNVTSTS